jgi:hypothetical protein
MFAAMVEPVGQADFWVDGGYRVHLDILPPLVCLRSLHHESLEILYQVVGCPLHNLNLHKHSSRPYPDLQKNSQFCGLQDFASWYQIISPT